MRKRTFKPYLKSDEAFREFVATADEDDVWNATSDVSGMAIHFMHKNHQNEHAKRMEAMFETGQKTYFDRFKKEWTPF